MEKIILLNNPSLSLLLLHVDQQPHAPIIHHRVETHHNVVDMTHRGQVWSCTSYYMSNSEEDDT